MASESTSENAHAINSDQAHDYLYETTTPHSLSQAVFARRAEFTRPHSVKVKVGSWNVAACPGVHQDIAGWFVGGGGMDKKLAGLKISEEIDETHNNDIESAAAQEARSSKGSKKSSTLPLGDEATIIGGDHIGLYVLGLQEVVELGAAKEYIGRVYTDPGPLTKWKKALDAAVPEGYQLVSEQQLSGLLLLIYASPVIAPTVGNVSSVAVGTGFLGYLGNKGAVCTRIMLGETTRLVFINCHLASGTEYAHLERRCWDFSQILARAKFEPVTLAGIVEDTQEGIGDEDFAFWFGDLNFRLDGLPGDDIRRLLTLHTRGEYDVGSDARETINQMAINAEPIVVRHIDSDDDESSAPSSPQRSSTDNGDDASSITLPDPDDFLQDPHSDPTSLQATIDSLLPHDQLREAQKKKMAFHDGWREGPITFLPTYKYDVGSVGMFDSSEKKRAPSWCDRILFRTRRDKLEYEGKSQQEELAKLKDEEMTARGIDHAADDDEVLFSYDPETDGENTGDYDENEDIGDQSETIITKEGFIDTIHLDVYASHQRVLSSDHKPLTAIFTLRYDAVVPELKSKIHQEVARELDRAENEGRPGITIVVDQVQDVEDSASPGTMDEASAADGIQGVDFGEVRYLVRKLRGLTIANTGRVTAKFAFVDRPSATGGPDRVGPDWLTVSFAGSELDEDERAAKNLEREVVLEPGDAVNAKLEVFVNDIEQVRALNDGAMQLDDVVVLRVTDGRDHFIPLRGLWMQSCFGRSIDELIRIPEGGVRALIPPHHDKSGKAVNRGQEVCWSAPRELFKLTETVEILTTRALADQDMIDDMHLPTEKAGWPFDQASWRITDARIRESQRVPLLEALDCDRNLGASFPPEMPACDRLEIVCEILLLFLNNLKDGIITQQLWDAIEKDIMSRKQSLNSEEERIWVLDVLSSAPNHNISLVFLTSMLCKIAAELAPIPHSSSRPTTASSKTGSHLRRSLSFGAKSNPVAQDAAVSKRKAITHRYAEIFAPVVIRGKGVTAVRDRDKKASEERKKDIIEVFLQGNREEGLD